MTKVEARPFVRATSKAGKQAFTSCESSGCESAGGCDGCCSGTCGGCTCDNSGFSPVAKKEVKMTSRGRVFTKK